MCCRLPWYYTGFHTGFFFLEGGRFFNTMCPLHSLLNCFIHMKAMQLLYTTFPTLSAKFPVQLAVISSKLGEGKLYLGG